MVECYWRGGVTASNSRAGVMLAGAVGFLLLLIVSECEAANIDICSDVERVDSDGQLSTNGYPKWFSAQHCQCDVTANVTTNLHMEVMFKTMDEPRDDCEPNIMVSSKDFAPFRLCPLTPESASNITKATVPLQVDHATRILLDNQEKVYMAVRIEYTSQPHQQLTVTCSGTAGLGVLTGSDSSVADNWWDRTQSTSRSRMDSSITAVIIIAIVIVIMLLAALVKSQMKKREFRQKQRAKQDKETRTSSQRDNPGYAPSVHTVNSYDVTLEDDVTDNNTSSATRQNSRDLSQPPVFFMNRAYTATRGTPEPGSSAANNLDLSLHSSQSSLGGTPDIRGHIPMGISALPDPHRSRQSMDYTPTSSRSGSRQPSTSDLRINPSLPSEYHMKQNPARRSSGGSTTQPSLDLTRAPPSEQPYKKWTPQGSPVDTRVPHAGLHLHVPSTSEDRDDRFRTPAQSPGGTLRGTPHYLNSSMSPALATNGLSLPPSVLPGETEL